MQQQYKLEYKALDGLWYVTSNLSFNDKQSAIDLAIWAENIFPDRVHRIVRSTREVIDWDVD